MKDSLVTEDLQPSPGRERTRQERSVVTRAELLKAGRRIFARDGFERTRIEDIAETAGKTRGAFYAHFEDKEDVFFAIFEEDIAKSQKQLACDLHRGSSSKEQRFDALAAHLKSKIEESDKMVLTLEFKMYALRNPDRRKRFTDLQTALCLRNTYVDYESLLPEFASSTPHGQTQMAQLSALVDGLALTRLLNPAGLDVDAIETLVRAGLRAILFE